MNSVLEMALNKQKLLLLLLKLLCASVQRAKKFSVPNRVSSSCHTRHLHVLSR